MSEFACLEIRFKHFYIELYGQEDGSVVATFEVCVENNK